MERDCARDSEHYRGTSSEHTLSVITYSVKPMRPRLSFAARGNLTELNSVSARSNTSTVPRLSFAALGNLTE